MSPRGRTTSKSREVAPFPPIPRAPKAPQLPADPRQSNSAHTIGAIAGIAGSAMRVSGPNLSTGFYASAVDVGRLQAALEHGLARFDNSQLEARWDEIFDWIRRSLGRGCNAASGCASNVARQAFESSSKHKTTSDTTSTDSTCFRSARLSRNEPLPERLRHRTDRQPAHAPPLQLLSDLRNHVRSLGLRRQNECVRQPNDDPSPCERGLREGVRTAANPRRGRRRCRDRRRLSRVRRGVSPPTSTRSRPGRTTSR